MAKIITSKLQIPKSQQKKIKNFNKLTDNQAILQYEMNKLRNRLSKQVDYTKFIKTPKVITKSFIEEIHNIRGKKVSVFFNKFETGKPLTSYEERQQKKYDRLNKQAQKLAESISDDEVYDSFYYEPDYSFDLNDEISKEIDYPEDPSDYWVDPTTGEAVHWDDVLFADMKRAAIEFLQDLKEQVRQSADNASIAHSYYQNGRTVNSKQRRYYDDNINTAMNTVIDKIDSILNNDEKLNSFTSKYKDATLSWEQLVLAASEYIAGSYKTKGGDPVQAARLNELLDTGPITMSDAMNFVDSAYDIDEYEE